MESLFGFAEPIASWLHLLGALVALLSLPRLMAFATTRAGRCSLALFGSGAVLALTISGLQHMFTPQGPARALFQRIDHACIWLLIASTFTPLHVILMRGFWRWGMLGVVWTAALLGVFVNGLFVAGLSEGTGTILYLSLGWLGAVSALLVSREHGWGAVTQLFLGGLIYSLGSLFYAFGWPNPWPHYIGHHELFHIAVLAALLLHWRFMQTLSRLEQSRYHGSDSQPQPVMAVVSEI
jgi:channel protein (hemolysin III family)